MRPIVKNYVCVLLLIALTYSPAYVLAQSVPNASNPVCAYCGCPLPNGTHAAGCPYATAGKSGGAKKGSHSMNMNAMVTSVMFESLLTSLFMDNTTNHKEDLAAKQRAALQAARQAAAMQREKAQAAQAAYEKMMRSYKQLDGTQSVTFKTLSNSNMAFKTLDGEPEALADGARKPFDTPSGPLKPIPETTGAATPFFGDTMPAADLEVLVHPENDPRVVDLRNAVNYVVTNIKNDSEKLAARTKPYTEKATDKSEPPPEYCKNLALKLDRLTNQRLQFQKTIDLAQEQLDTWRQANRNALWNAAKEGLDMYTGKLLDKFVKRAQAAERLQRIYTKNAAQMAQEGLDVAEIQAKIERLRVLSSTGRITELTRNISDWQTFVKDGVSGLMAQLTFSNSEIQEMLDDPRMQKYFETETPELKALLDITEIAASSKVFGKWVARKMPMIAAVQFSINQLYNATDWLLSYKRIVEANKINGRVLEAAQSIQRNIDETYQAMEGCP